MKHLRKIQSRNSLQSPCFIQLKLEAPPVEIDSASKWSNLIKSGKDSGLKSLSAIDSRYAFGAILLNALQIILSITEPQTL